MNDSTILRLIEEALFEDIGMGDVTTEAIVPPEMPGLAEVIVKESGIVAGMEIAGLVFQCIDPQLAFHPLLHDGERVQVRTTIAGIGGSLASILKAERTALNILQRMSGIATLTWMFVEAVAGTHAKITDTRKTPPGLRILDKLAVKIGGGVNHRFGLDEMMLIKNNHVDAAGGISGAIDKALKYVAGVPRTMKIEVETRNLDEVRESLKFNGIHRIMLDNFSIEEMKQAVTLIDHAVEVEASGNISLANVRAVAETGVDVISIGMLTHSPKALDISLTIRPQ